MHHARTTMTQLADKTTSSVRDTMQVTKDALDPRVHAARHPWAFVGGALVLGYAVGSLYRRGGRITTGVVPYYPSGAEGAAVMPMSGSSSSERRKSGVYPFYPHQAADHGEGNKARPIDLPCGPSWNEPSTTNSVWQGVASSDSDAVSSARWSVKLFPPSYRSFGAPVANGTLAPRATPRVDKSRAIGPR